MRHSAGVVLHRVRAGRREIFLVHPGGPAWAGRDAGAWSIPKGEIEPGEDAVETACRELTEETGVAMPEGEALGLGPVRQSARKTVHAWAIEGDADASAVRSNTFEMEWPKGSGRMGTFPEVDRAAWFDMATAKTKVHRGQVAIIERLERMLERREGT